MNKIIAVLLAVLLTVASYTAETLQLKSSHKVPVQVVNGEKVEIQQIELTGWGRGVAVSDTHVLTANHVVDGLNSEVQVNGKWYKIKNIIRDEDNDIALCEVEGVKLDPIEVLHVPQVQINGSKALEPVERRDTTLEHFMVFADGIKELAEPEDAGGISGSPVVIEGRLIGVVSAAGKFPAGIMLKCTGPAPIDRLLKKLKDK